MSDESRNRLSFKLFGLLSGEAEGFVAIAALVTLVLAVVVIWRIV
ncbi:hypothetical protein V5G24_10015 [Xanthobacter sp. VTT E-85241]